MSVWVEDTRVPGALIEHRDGVPWWKCPVPRRLFHKHQAQTRALLDGDYIERCVCGAFGPEPFHRIDPWPKRRGL